MDKTIIIYQVVTLFLMILVGFTARKIGVINLELHKGLNELLLKITAPLLALSSFQFAFSKALLAEAGMILIFAVSAHLFAIFFSKVVYLWHTGEQKKVLRFITIFTNCGFMGYPVVSSIYGQKGVFYTSIYVAVFNLFVWTYGVFIFTEKADLKSLKKALLNPGIIATLVGLFFFLFSIKMPEPIYQAIHTLGSMTTPIAMLVIGSALATVKTADLFSGFALYYGSFIRLLVMPLITIVVLKMFNFQANLLGVAVLLTAMPAAATAVPIAEEYQGDSLFTSRMVFVTTLLSVLTIPLIILSV
ncbi:MAG TPA: AEC family transporter [Bacillota bacterium]|nr:AEC family transporter [Bacillota bacterium]HOL10056.1 AEC family transporter [Bacillota bacterium]HPO98532.1 AEC family transporter [Bacillota bacterium]